LRMGFAYGFCVWVLRMGFHLWVFIWGSNRLTFFRIIWHPLRDKLTFFRLDWHF
jgi:hypothetical protein